PSTPNRRRYFHGRAERRQGLVILAATQILNTLQTLIPSFSGHAVPFLAGEKVRVPFPPLAISPLLPLEQAGLLKYSPVMAQFLVQAIPVMCMCCAIDLTAVRL